MKKMKLNIQLFATSGTLGTLSGSYKTAYTVTWELLSQNKSTNKSQIRLYGTLTTGNTTYIGSWYNADKFTINGTKVHGGWEKPGGTSGTVTVWQEYIDIEVEHNPDGTFPARTVTFTAYDHVAFTTEKSGSGTIPYKAVPDIPRQANILTAQDFNDEQNPTITYENKAGSSVDSLQACISLNGSVDNIEYRDVPKTGTLSYTFELTEEERKLLRQATINNPTRNVYFMIKTIIGGVEYVSKSEAKTLTIINADPIFNNFEFEDINEKIIALTGNNQSVILGYSNIKVTIPVANKAVAQKEATMSKYRFNNNEADYSDTEDVSIISNNVTSGEFIVYAIDSRKYAKSVLKSAVSVVDYKPLQKGNITTNRENGTSEDVILNVDGIINLINFGTKTNSILSAQYRYSIAGKNEWSELANLEIIVDENGNFSFDGKIKGDTDTLGFNVENAYNIEVYLKDELSEVKYTANFGAGIPHIAYAKNGVGIMGAYDESVGGLLQVGGKKLNIPNVYNTYSDSQTDVYSCNYINTIVESGSNENGSWEKWANGTMICRCTKSYPISTPNKTGPLYYGYRVLDDFPQPFIERPDITYSFFDSGDTVALQPYSLDSSVALSRTSAGAVYPLTINQHTSDVYIYIGYIAVGKWK